MILSGGLMITFDGVIAINSANHPFISAVLSVTEESLLFFQSCLLNPLFGLILVSN